MTIPNDYKKCLLEKFSETDMMDKSGLVVLFQM